MRKLTNMRQGTIYASIENLLLVSLFIFQITFSSSCSEENEPEKASKEEIEDEPKQLPIFNKLSQIDMPASSTSDVWGFEMNGKEYAVLANRGENTTIVDVSDPLLPTIVSTTVTMGGLDVKVWGNYLYVGQGSNSEQVEPYFSQIINISNPSDPTIVGTFPAVHNIFIDEYGYLYLTGYYSNSNISGSTSQGISIYDLNKDPEKPELVWTDTSVEEHLRGPAHDISVIRNKLYVFGSGRSGSETEIYNVNDQSSPIFLGSYDFQQNLTVHSGWVTEDDKYLFVCIEERNEENIDVLILDIANPANPILVGGIHDKNHIAHNLYIIGDYAYVSFYGAGLRIYDVSTPNLPILIYEYVTNDSSKGGFTGAFGVYPFASSENIYVSDTDNGLFIFSQE